MTIDGVWHNELGSSLTLISHPDGSLTGIYETRVGEAAGRFTVAGRFNVGAVGGSLGTAVGWTVAWSNDVTSSHSVTSWSGQYFAGEPERIDVTWLLVIESTPGEMWESTLVGQDVFTREAPADHTVRGKLDSGMRSAHPLRQLKPRGN